MRNQLVFETHQILGKEVKLQKLKRASRGRSCRLQRRMEVDGLVFIVTYFSGLAKQDVILCGQAAALEGKPLNPFYIVAQNCRDLTKSMEAAVNYTNTNKESA